MNFEDELLDEILSRRLVSTVKCVFNLALQKNEIRDMLTIYDKPIDDEDMVRLFLPWL